MSTDTIIVISGIILGVFLVLFVQWILFTVYRLDRLHIRYDLCWQALEFALARRDVVARSIGAELEDKELIGIAEAAENAPRKERYKIENDLSAALATIDQTQVRPQLVAELADAQARVSIAHRFHDDAVRYVRALRSSRTVRWCHLAHDVLPPEYFSVEK